MPAKLPPQTRIAGQQPFTPRQPDIVATSQAGTISEKSGNCRPAIWLSAISSRPEIFASVVIGVPSAPNATGEVLANQRQAGGIQRREAQADHQRGGDGHRRAETGGPFDKRAERKGDQQRLHAPIGRNARPPNRLTTSNCPARTVR